MSAPRICIVAPEFIGPFPNGGVGTACYWEAVILGRAGYDVTVLYTGTTERETPEYWEEYFATNAPFRYEDLSRRTSPEDVTRLSPYEQSCGQERTAEFVLTWLQRRHFDLVLFQEFLGHGSRALQARRSGTALDGTRAATTMHSCRQWIYEGMKRLPGGPWDVAVDFLEKESARIADRVIAPSRHMAAWAASRWRLASPAAVIPYCYDPALAKSPQIVSHVGPFRHLVFFGRLETRKGLHLFCRALVEDAELRDHVERVTFLGKPSNVEGRPSEEFIASHMDKIPEVQWEVIGDAGSFEAQAWLKRQKNILVVAPSLVDNLPYAVIELHTHRIPFVSTNIGGIPEIVGDANQRQLAQPTEASLATVIRQICRDGRLDVDYRSGFEVSAANAAHVDFVRSMLAEPAPCAAATPPAQFQVVVTNAADEAALAELRARVIGVNPITAAARWVRFENWMEAPGAVPALFIDTRVSPEADCTERLLTALAQPSVDVATSYFSRQDDLATVRVVAPFGGSLEMGWRRNRFGGPCFAAHPTAFAAVRDAAINGTFRLWPAYAAVACRGLSISVVTKPLYTVAFDAVQQGGHAELEAVVHQYHSQMPGDFDLGWTLKSAMGGGAESAVCETIGRALYERLISTPDELLTAYAGLNPEPETDPYVRDFAQVRARVSEALARWRSTEPRVFVYGAGQHTRMLLALCPKLGPYVEGFIDRQAAGGRVLGKPCVTPEQFRSEMADAVVYSSREFEHEMYERLKEVPVEHLLLYRESPPAPEATTTARVRNRFGSTVADPDSLKAMFQPPSWAIGHVSGADATFLHEMIGALQPENIVELGVASGVSSAVILHALDRLPDADCRVLYSCDVRPTCYFDEAYATGQACREMYPSPRAGWYTSFESDARELARVLPIEGADLTFIDANHAHPYPLLDLLQVTTFAKPGSWVILHDVDLPIQHPQFQTYGPRWLFHKWPFNKIKAFDRWASIGAVQLPEDPSQLVPMVLALLDKPWEQPVTAASAALPPAFAAVQAALEARLPRRALVA
ncbi:MAG TPA: glycosyltransferase [Vicinamibacterales bacterium]|jgi:glycosyltransferase involved in cell wall biosynthesis/predicted O-methyltransferase YrrM|nr:glycosyltransferase [Vicinamibacterales bacterium]